MLRLSKYKNSAYCFALYYLFVFFIACDSKIEIRNEFSQSKYVVEAYLATDDSIKIRISQSYDYYIASPFQGDGIPDTLYSFPVVTLTHNNQNYNLVRSYQKVFPHPSTFYTLPKSVFSIPASGNLSLHIGTTSLHGEAMATSDIPLKILISSFRVYFDSKKVRLLIPDTISHTVSKDTIVTGYRPAKLSIFGSFPKRSYGLVQLFKLTPIQKELYVSEVFSNPDGNQKIVLSSTRITTGLIDTSGTWELSLFSIDKIYYDFYHAAKSQEDGSADLGNLLFDAMEVPSNIKGGLGIFTTMAVDTMRMAIP